MNLCYTIQFSYLGYETVTQSIELTSAKELILNINMVEGTTSLAKVKVTAVAGRGQVRNESTFLYAQPYVQSKITLSPKWKATAGLTMVYASINNNSFSPPEPRMGPTSA